LFAQWLNERLWERTVSYDGTNSKCLKVRSKSLNFKHNCNFLNISTTYFKISKLQI
jgi:hypothetical protein